MSYCLLGKFLDALLKANLNATAVNVMILLLDSGMATVATHDVITYLKKRGKTPKFHTRMLEQQQLRYYRELFNYLDTDKSGELELAEILMTLRRLQMNEAASSILSCFKSIDTNHDGAVSFPEFLAVMTADEVESTFGKCMYRTSKYILLTEVTHRAQQCTQKLCR